MIDSLRSFFTEILDASDLRVTFGAKRKKSQLLRRTTLRPIGSGRFQFEYFSDTQAFHKNCDRDEAVEEALKLCAESFKQIDGRTGGEEFQILASRPEQPRIVRRRIVSERCEIRNADSDRRSARCEPPAHDRSKRYLLADGTPVDFLVKLGVMDARGRVYPRSYAKFRQINRFLEVVDDVFAQLGEASPPDGERGGSPGGNPLRVVDFGCGKAYLTFALYHYFTVIRKRPTRIVGLDLKRDVVEFCENTARELGYEGLRFECGDIADYETDGADLVVSLHACDTATDHAIARAVRWNARVILCVPCCQHELFSQLSSELHAPILKHGIIRDKFTELLTDGVRALKLESLGYDVSMIEFTSLEHTAKNILIRAHRRDLRTETARRAEGRRRETAERDLSRLIEFWGIDPAIDRLLR